MRRSRSEWILVVMGLSLAGCKSQAEPAAQDTGDEGAAGAPGQPDDEEPIGPVTSVSCTANSDCNDGAYCNGTERCVDGFCHLGVAPICNDGIACTEDSCSHTANSCVFHAPDQDGDGHTDAACTGPSGEPLGDDCDDDDANRYPGNFEVCDLSAPTHDEDCNPSTVGHRDDDADGSISDACCNEGDDGTICGDDCDDDNFSRNPTYPEICDNIDNNCDDKVDVNTKEVLWYPDLDGDNYGEAGSVGVLDCSPVDGHALQATDCDDSTAAVHSAALEICDGVDNDCDGDIDEGGVCACAPEGNARACACTGGYTGVQSCSGGVWNVCDCTECITGTVDCLGDLLPRTCVAGRWVIESACTGIRPICLAGGCVCSDGTNNCQQIDDIVRPTLVASAPAQGDTDVPQDVVIAAVFSEDVSSLSITPLTVTLVDELDHPIPGAIAVGGASLTFTPTTPLSPGLNFEFRLEGGISDLAGNTLGTRKLVQFSTAPAAPALPLGSPPSITYDDPVLAVSPGGTAMIIATRTDNQSIVVGTEQLDWSGTAWTDVGLVHTDSGNPSSLTVDDSGRAIATLKSDPWVYKYDFDSSVWVADPTALTSTDDTSVAPVLVSNGAGNGLIGVDVEGEMTGFIRAPGGAYSQVTTPASDVESFRVGDISESQYPVIAWDQASLLHVWRGNAGLVSFAKAPTVGSGPEPISDAAVIMGEDGIATVAWVQRLDNGGGPAFDMLQIQDLSTSATWIGSPEFVGGAWKGHAEISPRLGNDGTGRTHLAYLDNNGGHTVRTMNRAAGQAWGPNSKISLGSGGFLYGLQLEVAATGHAMALWIDGTTATTELWGARYLPGGPWLPPERLESLTGSITQAQLQMDDAGNAHVIFLENEWYSLYLTP